MEGWSYRRWGYRRHYMVVADKTACGRAWSPGMRGAPAGGDDECRTCRRRASRPEKTGKSLDRHVVSGQRFRENMLVSP